MSRNQNAYFTLSFLCFSGVSHDELIDLARYHFGKLPGRYQGEAPALPLCHFTGSEVSLKANAPQFAAAALLYVTVRPHCSFEVTCLMVYKLIVAQIETVLFRRSACATTRCLWLISPLRSRLLDGPTLTPSP